MYLPSSGEWDDVPCPRDSFEDYHEDSLFPCLCETGPLGPATSAHFLKHKDELRRNSGLKYCKHQEFIWIFFMCAFIFLPCALCLGGRNLIASDLQEV